MGDRYVVIDAEGRILDVDAKTGMPPMTFGETWTARAWGKERCEARHRHSVGEVCGLNVGVFRAGRVYSLGQRKEARAA